MTMVIVSPKAVIGSFPVFLIQRKGFLAVVKKLVLSKQSSGLLTMEQSCFIAVGQNVTHRKKGREIDAFQTFPFLNLKSTPLAPSLWQKCMGILWTHLATAEPQDKLILNYLYHELDLCSWCLPWVMDISCFSNNWLVVEGTKHKCFSSKKLLLRYFVLISQLKAEWLGFCLDF